MVWLPPWLHRNLSISYPEKRVAYACSSPEADCIFIAVARRRTKSPAEIHLREQTGRSRESSSAVPARHNEQ